jgi:ribosomal protein S18 acetylase RimI-like enzyme
VRELFRRCELARPRDEPHYSLSLFATKPECRGRGIGMALLRDDLARIDAEGACAYLESTNPTNNARYAGVGFATHGQFEHPTTGAPVTTMWRPSQRA